MAKRTAPKIRKARKAPAPAKEQPKAPKAPKTPKEVEMVECPDCPKGKFTGKASGLKDENTLCPTCEGHGVVEA